MNYQQAQILSSQFNFAHSDSHKNVFPSTDWGRCIICITVWLADAGEIVIPYPR
jgi:hypothetical protein